MEIFHAVIFSAAMLVSYWELNHGDKVEAIYWLLLVILMEVSH